MLPFPAIDPVAFEIGPLAVRWYALAYIAGVLLGWKYAVALAISTQPWRRDDGPTALQIEDSITWLIVGILLGGRLGYVLFYNFPYYINHPSEILMIWHGGMAFHGGMLGVIAAAWIFAKRKQLPFLSYTDLIVCAAPIGLFFGRLANFVNGELYGRVTDVSWGMVFPNGGDLPRHPSQLYEAALEGIVLFIIMAILVRIPFILRRTGTLSGCFLLFYGLFRGGIEFLREPDPQLGFLYGDATMGQLLCVPMIGLGLYLIFRPRGKQSSPNAA